MTQLDLSSRLGVLPRTVANWEADRSEPRGNRLAMLAGVLGVSMNWLITGNGEESYAGDGHLAETRSVVLKIGRLKSLHRQAAALTAEIETDFRRLQDRLDGSGD